MLFELILFFAILAIFIMVLRKLPDALRESHETTIRPGVSVVAKSDKKVVASRLHLPTISQIGAQATAQWRRLVAARPQAVTSAKPKMPGSQNVQLVRSQESLLTEEVLMREGDVYLEQGKLKEAERAFLRAVAKSPRQPKLYNRLGAIYLKQRNYTDALEAFQAARDLDATRASRHYNVALAAWHLGKPAKAKEAINEAIRIDGESAKYHELKRQIEEGA